MHALVALFFFLAQPFWETKPPEKWSYQEIETLRSASPWAQTVGPEPAVLIYFATARPIEDAEAELRLRQKNTLTEPDADYLAYLNANRNRQFVLAIPYERALKPLKSEDERRMEDESVMLIGRKRYRMVGHFPPVAADPVLRLVFPREIQPTDKRVVFQLYLPGIVFPDREAEFTVKDMMYHGKLAL
jgi:hypothetical protein